MLHATTADRGNYDAGTVIATNHGFGYVLKEISIPKAGRGRVLEVGAGTSLYCLRGRGWITTPGGNIRYSLEPGTVFADDGAEAYGGLVIVANQDLTVLRISPAG